MKRNNRSGFTKMKPIRKRKCQVEKIGHPHDKDFEEEKAKKCKKPRQQFPVSLYLFVVNNAKSCKKQGRTSGTYANELVCTALSLYAMNPVTSKN